MTKDKNLLSGNRNMAKAWLTVKEFPPQHVALAEIGSWLPPK
jgi:hypothetical protein